jgi:hypothetical protein
METGEMNLLSYRRQYLLVTKKINCPFVGHTHTINERYTLYAHVDLAVCKVSKGDTSIYLLGDLFDYRDPSKGNKSILNDLITCNFEQLTELIAHYSGRFVIIFTRNGLIHLLHDAMATRKIYYVFHNKELWMASQPHLLAKVTGIRHTANKEKLLFYNSEAFHQLHNASIGNTTCYDGIFQLMPNHFLDVSSFQVKRYWPNRAVHFRPVNEVVEQCSEMINGFMEGIANRYKVMLPVTAGKDSRMLMAGSGKCKEKIFFYVNREKCLNPESADLKIPVKLFNRLGLNFHVIDPYLDIDDDFKTVYFSNNPYASEKFLPHIYNYYKNYADRVNLPGNIASAGYELYNYKEMEITAESLAHLNNVGTYKYAISYYESWLNSCKDICAVSNLTLLHLFYWEERMGNWGSQVQLDKDIAQEDINPFNCRKLVETFLSVPGKFLERPDFLLQRKIISHMWPELLQVPINPGRLKRTLKLLKLIGALDSIQKLIYEMDLRRKRNLALDYMANESQLFPQ